MDPLDIKCALRKKGYFLRDIAKRCGTSDTAVSNTVHGRPFTSPRIQQEIADILGVSKESLWPVESVIK